MHQSREISPRGNGMQPKMGNSLSQSPTLKLVQNAMLIQTLGLLPNGLENIYFVKSGKLQKITENHGIEMPSPLWLAWIWEDPWTLPHFDQQKWMNSFKTLKFAKN